MYKAGLVGCGVIGTRFGDAISAHDELILEAACDVDSQRVGSFATEYGATAYTDYERMLAAADLDFVHVGVPPALHPEVVTAALDNDRHLICEKPLAPNADDGAVMVDRASESDQVTAVNLPFRYTPGFRDLVHRVAAGKIGEPKRIELRFRFPRWPRSWQDVSWLESRDQGGPLREVGTHFLFGVQELFGPVERVSATVKYRAPDKYETSIVGTFSVGGIDGIIDLLTDHEQPEENLLTVTGTEGSLSLTDWHRLVADAGTTTASVLTADDTSTTRLLLDEFVDELNGNGGDLVGFHEANQVQRAIDAILASEAPVRLDDPA